MWRPTFDMRFRSEERTKKAKVATAFTTNKGSTSPCCPIIDRGSPSGMYFVFVFVFFTDFTSEH